MRAHFALHTTPESEHALRTHLADCAECTARYQRHLWLSELDPRAPSAQDRLASGLGLRVHKATQSGSWFFAASAVAIAAAALLFFRSPPELTARGPGLAVSQVLAYRVQPGRPAAPLGPSITRSDELAFAYVNGAGYRHLLIYGVDEHGHVYWYHPAWTNAAETPHAIAIVPGTELRELPEAVAHDLDGKHLTLHAVFTNRDVTVRDAEHGVALALGDGIETRIELEVE
jgi:hypothetical protein